MKEVTDPKLLALLEAETGSPKPRKTSMAGAGLAGTLQGVTFGTSDEIAAGLGSAYDYVTGGGKGYDQRLQEQRDYLAAARSENPLAYYGGEIAGGLAVPGGIARTGARLGSQVARGAVAGGVTGAATGFGTSEGGVENRLLGARDGAVVGTVVGGAAPAVVRGVSNAYRGARDAVGTVIAPERAAARAVDEARRIDMTRGQQPQLPAGVPDERLTLDTGETTRALGRQASNMSPEARQDLAGVVHGRFSRQGERLMQVLRQRFGVNAGNSYEARQTLQNQARQANRRNYRTSFADGDREIMTPNIEQMTSSPMFVQAMKKATKNGKNRAALDGYSAFNPGVRVRKGGLIEFTRGESGVPQYPNLQYWDYVKRELDDIANSARRQGKNERAAQAGELAQRLRGELDVEVPSYQTARGQAANFFGADDALTAGEEFARRSADFNINEVRPLIENMKSAERAAFREGFLSRTMEEIRATPDNREVVQRFVSGPGARERLELALGQDAARDIQNFAAVEAIMDRARTALGNSTTARQLMEMGLGGAMGGFMSGGNMMSPEFWISAFAGAQAGRFRAARADRWARQIVQLLNSDGPALERHLRRLGRNPELSRAFQDAVGNLADRSAAAAGTMAGENAAVGE